SYPANTNTKSYFLNRISRAPVVSSEYKYEIIFYHPNTYCNATDGLESLTSPETPSFVNILVASPSSAYQTAAPSTSALGNRSPKNRQGNLFTREPRRRHRWRSSALGNLNLKLPGE
ncbi:unnamed protein product, partial [Ectocarpus sp. 4 AP-2014]